VYDKAVVHQSAQGLCVVAGAFHKELVFAFIKCETCH